MMNLIILSLTQMCLLNYLRNARYKDVNTKQPICVLSSADNSINVTLTNAVPEQIQNALTNYDEYFRTRDMPLSGN